MSLSSMWCQDGEVALFTRFIVGIPAGTLPGTADPPGNIVVHPPETSIFKIKRKKKGIFKHHMLQKYTRIVKIKFFD